MKTKVALKLMAFSLILFGLGLPVFGQGTAFSYRGNFSDSGGPANGSYDLTFSIFDSTNMPGILIAGPLTNTATPVINGVFVVTLDFGGGVFTGPARWLEIAVQTNGGTNFTTLSPRQPVMAVPYAVMANSASNLLGNLPVSQLSGTVPLAQLPVTVVTNNGSNLQLNGQFTGDGSGLSNLNYNLIGNPPLLPSTASLVATNDGRAVSLTNPANQFAGAFVGDGSGLTNVNAANVNGLFSGALTWTGTNTFTNLAQFTGPVLLGTNTSWSDYNNYDWRYGSSPFTIFSPSGAGYGYGFDAVGDYRNGVSGERYGVHITPGGMVLGLNSGIVMTGDANISRIPTAAQGMIDIGQDVTSGIVQYHYTPYDWAYQIFTSPDGTGEPTDDNYPEGMQTFGIQSDGFTTIWKRGYNLGSMFQLIESDYEGTNSFAFDVSPNGLLIGPVTNGVGPGTNNPINAGLNISPSGDVNVGGNLSAGIIYYTNQLSMYDAFGNPQFDIVNDGYANIGFRNLYSGEDDFYGFGYGDLTAFIVHGPVVATGGYWGLGTALTNASGSGYLATNGDGSGVTNLNSANISTGIRVVDGGVVSLSFGTNQVSSVWAYPTNIIQVSYYSLDGTLQTCGYSNIVNGTSFTVFSGSPTDTNSVSWSIIVPH